LTIHYNLQISFFFFFSIQTNITFYILHSLCLILIKWSYFSLFSHLFYIPYLIYSNQTENKFLRVNKNLLVIYHFTLLFFFFTYYHTTTLLPKFLDISLQFLKWSFYALWTWLWDYLVWNFFGVNILKFLKYDFLNEIFGIWFPKWNFQNIRNVFKNNISITSFSEHVKCISNKHSRTNFLKQTF